jgi:hypothetical protein
MAGLVREAAEPRPAGDSVKAAIRRAATVLRMPDRRVHRYWYRQPDIAVGASEYLETRRRIDEKRRREIDRLRMQLATIEAMRQDNRDALVADARALLGPLFDRLVSMGLVKMDGLEAPEDGEA